MASESYICISDRKMLGCRGGGGLQKAQQHSYLVLGIWRLKC